MFKNRINTLRSKLKESNIDVALITDDDNVYYYTGYYDYLHMEFGRPTILIVPKEDKTILITPAVDSGLAEDDALVIILNRGMMELVTNGVKLFLIF